MSNKPFESLNILDKELRRAFPPNLGIGPVPKVQLTIKKITAFELFNTRPHHNYENWSDGYIVEGYGTKIEAEDLDDAIHEFIRKVKAARDDPQRST